MSINLQLPLLLLIYSMVAGLPSMAVAEVLWPQKQILPSFSLPRETQDLFFLHTRGERFEAEALQHRFGAEENGVWVARPGKDNTNGHMVYGPYIRLLPLGNNSVDFRLKTSASPEQSSVAIIQVHDATRDEVIASRELKAKDFAKIDEFQNFSLPFQNNAPDHSLEFRVIWSGNSELAVDWIELRRNRSEDEMVLFASLKGLINRTEPRLFSYEGDAFAEGPHTWLNSLGLKYNEISDKWTLLKTYQDEIKGLLVYDPQVIDTMNLATTLAAENRALVVSPALKEVLTKEPYNFPVIEDFRGRFANKMDVYETLLKDYWPKLNHRLLIGLNPKAHLAALREYASAVGVATIWLDPDNKEESELLNRFLSAMDPGSSYMGWWPEEAPGVKRASEFGVATIASDWSTNLTVHSGMPREIKIAPIPVKPELKNKIYVGFILSDGDNLQYVEHLMRKLWNNPARGKVAIGWTVSPAMVDAMPGALNFLHESSTENDNLISGPSGFGYIYPNDWKDKASLAEFVKKTDEYNQLAGLRVITVWNTIVGGISEESGRIYSENSRSLLGLTAQNTGGGLSMFASLPSLALSCNYCTNEGAMKEHIARAAKDWSGKEPRFLLIQAQPWTNVTPETFLRVKESLGEEYEVIRPDHLFELLREAKGQKL